MREKHHGRNVTDDWSTTTNKMKGIMNPRGLEIRECGEDERTVTEGC